MSCQDAKISLLSCDKSRTHFGLMHY